MRTAARYLLREYALASGTVFLALGLTWVAADTLLRLDQLSETPLGAPAWIAWRAVEFVGLGAPLACVVGVVWSVTRAVRAREVTAIRCGGIPLRGALAPIVIASALLAPALAFFEDRVVIDARRAHAEADLAARGGAGRPPVVKNGRWWHASGSTVFSAARYLAEERALVDVRAFEFDAERRIRRRIDAERAVHVERGVWEFEAARFFEFPGAGGIEQYEATTLRVDLGITGADLERAERIQITSLHGLAERMRDAGAGLSSPAVEAAFHGRLARPLALVILVMLALPFAVGDVERGDSLPRALLASLAVAVAFFGCWASALAVAGRGWLPPPLPVWAVVLLFATLGYARFRAIRE